GRNQLIAATSQISLWALTSSELQIHVNTRPERTKLVLPDDICGIPAYEPQPRQNSGSRAIAHASSSNGGSAVAYVEINPSGQVRVYASSSGDGVAIASVRTDGSSAGYVYVVQTGDNLFRIALENDTTVDALASLNDIEDPDTIRIGQRLVIP
ncbi:MAG: LysM domain-containing protein, partial [Chloroflexota bacterium]